MDSSEGLRNYYSETSKEEFRKRRAATLKKTLSNPSNREQRRKQLAQANQRNIDLFKSPDKFLIHLRKLQSNRNWSEDHLRMRFLKKFPGQEHLLDNHRIVDIQEIGIRETFDMKVDDYHNFAVNGIFVHNSAEDQEGHAFAGGAGWHLLKTLRARGWDLERDCWSTNAQTCHDTKQRHPPNVVEDCRPNLLRTVRETQPNAIILAGGYALQSLIGHVWKPDTGPIGRWTGPGSIAEDPPDPRGTLLAAVDLAVAAPRTSRLVDGDTVADVGIGLTALGMTAFPQGGRIAAADVDADARPFDPDRELPEVPRPGEAEGRAPLRFARGGAGPGRLGGDGRRAGPARGE